MMLIKINEMINKVNKQERNENKNKVIIKSVYVKKITREMAFVNTKVSARERDRGRESKREKESKREREREREMINSFGK